MVRRAGYMEAKVTSERKIDDENKKVADIAVHVEAGPQFTMGKLKIVGLDLNAEAEMRRIWGLKDGQALQSRLSGAVPEPDQGAGDVRQSRPDQGRLPRE